jgi:peptide/nickel transport system permease protein
MASSANVAKLEDSTNEDIRRLTHTQRALMRLKKDYLTIIALGFIFLLIILAVTAPIITEMMGVDPESENLSNIYASPSFENEHILGTDDKGRDHFARLLFGSQISLSVAFSAAFLSITIGVTLGMLTGYYGGVVDDIMNWFVTTLDSIPSLYLLLIVVALLRPGPLVFVLVLSLLGWTGTLRLVRGETLSLREREYIVAARAMGAGDWRIMFQHIFPNLISIVVISLAIDIGGLILTESALSFLGFGIPSYIPTWGNMLSRSQDFFRKAPHLVIAPGLLISFIVLALYVVGDGLRDALDPTVTDG